jgi:hypothetical protein
LIAIVASLRFLQRWAHPLVFPASGQNRRSPRAGLGGVDFEAIDENRA